MLRRLSISLFLLMPLWCAAQEVCNNAMDDDNDGLIDLNDPDCPCSTVITPADVVSYIVNPSFELRETTVQGTPCCPYGYVSGAGPDWFSGCAMDWNQATEATSDYYHMCGFAPATFPLPPPDGEGAVGFISMPDYKEYVGACLTAGPDPQPLLAGTTYTLSIWISMFAATSTNSPSQFWMQSYGTYYQDPFPLAIFGSANCVPFPIPALNCIGDVPGWQELGRAYHQPNSEWERLSITFTPTVEIRSVIIGPACDLPASFIIGYNILEGPDGPVSATPYTLVDNLMLTEAQDQVLTPVTATGHLCLDNVMVAANPPVGATDHQWYLNGVAVLGQTNTTMDPSALGLGWGTYALASTYDGQCLMGSTNVAEPVEPTPRFSITPTTGCAPLEVAFADTTAPATIVSHWTFGDGASADGATTSHMYSTPGTYDVTLTVTSPQGCEGDSTRIGAIVVSGPPAVTITASPNPTDVEHTTVMLSAGGANNDIVAWWWDLGAVLPGESTQETVTTTFPPFPGEYPVTLAVRTVAGCMDTVRSRVVVTLNGEIEMPNVFSPNGDGRNDNFVPLNYEGTTGLLEIYNRWGQLLYTTTSLAQGWNGKVTGSESPEGTYFYTVLPLDGEEETHSGHITLVR